MKFSRNLSLRTLTIVALTLLALLLGGSTELWAQAVIVILAALLILFFPPRVKLDPVPAGVALLFLGIAFSAFLPDGWGLLPEWRRHLTQDLQVPLGNFRTPQPWLTLQACGLLLFGITWACYLILQEWQPPEKSAALRLLAVGIVFMATLSIFSYCTGFRIPGWNQEANRGWFPNRNQTADVLALGGIVNYVIMLRRFQKRQWTGGLWLVGLGLICTALVISYSRAGILIFFLGITVWHLGSLFRPKKGKSVAVGLSSLLILLSLFLLFGGATLERFLNLPEPDNPHELDYRVLIQEDAVKVSLQTPFLGVGLGNFEPVFTSMRQISADQNRTLHPESDWLWIAVEMGWLAPLLILVGLKWWAGQCVPFAHKPGESLRRAAMVAFVMFIVHGFVDVSGHRLGSVGVALLLASISLSLTRPVKASPWVAPLFRCLAGILVLMGGWWLSSCFSDEVPPTSATLARLQTRIGVAVSDRRLASIGQYANAALEIAPLDWTYYFRRATAEAFRTGATAQAAKDFQIARFLEPNWINLCLNEGGIWLVANEPDRCLAAWKECLRRAGSGSTSLYKRMLELSPDNAAVRAGLQEQAHTNIDYLLVFLNFATPDEGKMEITGLLTRDPNLSSLNPEQRKKLFSAWNTHGDQNDLAEQLSTHEDWQTTGWSYLARHFADQGNFEMASVTALRQLKPPFIPRIPPEHPLAEMSSLFDSHPDDLVMGVMLYQAQAKADKIDDALATLATLEKLKDCPAYVFYLNAQLCVKQQKWEDAWNALRQYAGKQPGTPSLEAGSL